MRHLGRHRAEFQRLVRVTGATIDAREHASLGRYFGLSESAFAAGLADRRLSIRELTLLVRAAGPRIDVRLLTGGGE